jgi:hypothetical protein
MVDKIWEGSPTYTYIEQLKSNNAELVKALRPFANFACSPSGECKCNNCVARDLVDKYEIKE